METERYSDSSRLQKQFPSSGLRSISFPPQPFLKSGMTTVTMENFWGSLLAPFEVTGEIVMNSCDGRMPSEMEFLFSAFFLITHSSCFPFAPFKSHCIDLGNCYFPTWYSAHASGTYKWPDLSKTNQIIYIKYKVSVLIFILCHPLTSSVCLFSIST